LNGLTRLHSSFDTATDKLEISPLTAVVIVTRGHQHDENCLKSVLKSKANYIGLIGSKRRIRGVFQRLYDQGFSRLETDRIFAPIGLAIHAKTPEEIAIAILAQIIQVMNNEGANIPREERQ
jgi:xanthine dehydrogenase accessory factor